ncbi:MULTISPECIES: hemolysin family protein [Komagataeibacter]|uniref:HlyC/CorC family transporter n=2 Tax=Komagataeibacter TaxID=1434011 RepID=A0A318QXV6_9PROT|nr:MULTISPECIES: hemolysin family protein [Komagataeibacter]MBT0676508.1 HlyC/CorC family transporter [Komagataeibacter oboediens]MBT0678135.1 HlyC/CorC family transporter [Komagataeibacter oboediens]MBV1825714.1 hemolysin family protein [Komagataeibacter oboediens]PYD82192.1 HlyC/CorC family transporter [Komagataeibacter oboediens]GAO00296.1 hemolysin/magnesium/cobalt transporter CorC/HlyC [Komagataeibacter xylinus NBRC 13693]
MSRNGSEPGGEPPSGSRGKGFLSLFSRKRGEQGLRHSIAALVKEADDAAGDEADPRSSELDRQERALLANVLRLRGITADDVMIPRADIVAMPVDISLDEALAMMRRENHSRMPVYREQLDDIVGMIHVKDLIAYVGTSEAFRMEPLLRQPLMVAPQLPVLDLLLQMRQRHVHLALVIDEYGGIDGLVTIEDLIETIVGDISDEHDEPTVNMMRDRPDGTLDVDARTPVAAFEEKVGPILTREEREAEIETVGGLVFRLAGHVPTRGEVVTHESGMVFRILDADARHIRRVRVRLPPPEAPPAT